MSHKTPIVSSHTDSTRSLNNYSSGLNFTVDLDVEKGRPSRTGDGGQKTNEHRVRIVKASNDRVRLFAIESYLRGQSEFSNSVLEAISL